jgi:hypothetical protein
MTRTILSLVACGSLLVACGDDTTGTGGSGQGGDNAGGSGQTSTTTMSTSSMGGGGEGGGTTAENAQIRVAHLSPDAPAVDVCVFTASDMLVAGPVLKGAGDTDGLAYPDATGYVPLPAGSYKFRIVAPNAANCDTALAGLPDVGPLALAAGEAYTAAAIGQLGTTPATFEVTAFADNLGAPAAGKAHLRFVHASDGTPNVDVGLAGATFTPVWSNIAYGDAGDYTPVDAPFTSDVGAAIAGTATPAIVFTNINIPAGAIVDVFAIGLLGDQDTPLGALACVVGGSSGRSSTCRVSPSASTTARSMTFSSSRTLPGQGCASRTLRAWASTPRTWVPRRALLRSMKASMSTGMSSRRSRRGGTFTWSTLRR